MGLVQGKLEELQDHRLIGPQHFAVGDAEKQAVADLAGGAGHGNANGVFHAVLLARVGHARAADSGRMATAA